jgi:hypothetical protein
LTYLEELNAENELLLLEKKLQKEIRAYGIAKIARDLKIAIEELSRFCAGKQRFSANRMFKIGKFLIKNKGK